jgi:hypothetical protein
LSFIKIIVVFIVVVGKGKRKEEDRLSRFINVTVKGIEKKNNRIVIQEGQELFEFPSMFMHLLKATMRRKTNLWK